MILFTQLQHVVIKYLRGRLSGSHVDKLLLANSGKGKDFPLGGTNLCCFITTERQIASYPQPSLPQSVCVWETQGCAPAACFPLDY